MTFQEDAVVFMQNLLIQLERESEQARSGAVISRETAEDVFLRLVGVFKNANIESGGQRLQATEDPTENQESSPDLLNNFFKIQTNSVVNDLRTINRLLRAYRTRLNRYSKSRVKIKLNRIKRLVDEPENPINTQNLVKDAPEDTRREVSKKLGELREGADITGLIEQEVRAHRALTTSIEGVTQTIPNEVENLRPQLISLLRALGRESIESVEELTNLKNAFSKEVDRLENMDKLLFEGQQTFNGNAKLSLIKVLDVLIFLTDRQQMKYNCSQCKFFQQGETSACTFAGEGTTARTRQVTVTDEQGNEVKGRETQSTNSCKNVWGLNSNEYFTPSDSIIQSLKNRLTE